MENALVSVLGARCIVSLRGRRFAAAEIEKSDQDAG